MARYQYRDATLGAPPNVAVRVTGPGTIYPDADTRRPIGDGIVYTDANGTLTFWADTLGAYTATWTDGTSSLTVTGTPGATGAPANVGDTLVLAWTGLTTGGDLPTITPQQVGGSVVYSLLVTTDADRVARVTVGGLYRVRPSDGLRVQLEQPYLSHLTGLANYAGETIAPVGAGATISLSIAAGGTQSLLVERLT